MIDFFGENKGLAEGKFYSINGKSEAARKWNEFAILLNGTRGADKSAAQWQVAWRDIKSRTSVKARERRKQMAATGNWPLLNTPLTELDLRVLDITGPQYVEGSSNCADSIPEKNELQITLETGNDDVLLASPTVPTILKAEIVMPENVEVQRTPVKRRRIEPPSTQWKLNSKKNFFESSRDQFAHLAKQQADAMTMQAEAMKMQADAITKQAEASLMQFPRFWTA